MSSSPLRLPDVTTDMEQARQDLDVYGLCLLGDALFTYFCRPFVRQQENFSLSVAPAVLARCSRELKSLLGFQVWHTLGMIEGTPHGTINDRPERFSRELRPGA